MFFVLTASAADPIALVDDGTLVHSIDWARPFELQQPHPYRYAAAEQAITTGWLVQLTVESWTMFPRQVGVPNLWIGDRIAGRIAGIEMPGAAWLDLVDGPVTLDTAVAMAHTAA